jgi:hypothetical protein
VARATLDERLRIICIHCAEVIGAAGVVTGEIAIIVRRVIAVTREAERRLTLEASHLRESGRRSIAPDCGRLITTGRQALCGTELRKSVTRSDAKEGRSLANSSCSLSSAHP